jgi:homoserine dehydrogenase
MVRVFKIAVCGAGVVGGGVINLIKRQHALFRACNFDFEVKTVRVVARPHPSLPIPPY